MYGLGVGVRGSPEVLEGSHGLVGSFELIVDVKIVSVANGYVGS